MNTYTLNFGGGDLWNTSDSFFFASTASTDTSKTIIAKVDTFKDDNTDVWSKTGIQIRFGTTVNAKNVSVVLDKSNNISLQYRSSRGASTQEISVNGVSVPVWMKISRSGSQFTGLYSIDGNNWMTIGTVTVSMNGTIYSGIFGAKNSIFDGYAVSTFSNLQGF